MCTLITSNKLTGKLLEQMYEDNLNNPHGISLLILDQYAGMIDLSCHDLDLAITVLQRNRLDIKRFWLHQRYATSNNIETIDCHNYRTQAGYYVQHNGIIHNQASYDYRVDSQYIAAKLDSDYNEFITCKESAGMYLMPDNVSEDKYQKECLYPNTYLTSGIIEDTLTEMIGGLPPLGIKEYLAENEGREPKANGRAEGEDYLNAFIVAADGSHFFVVRSIHGLLHTDKSGRNYSSHPTGNITIPVPYKYIKRINT